MNIEKFAAAYAESRNGANQFFRHPLARSFAYSDGVQECAECGLYWLLDILATELPPLFKEHDDSVMCIVYVRAFGGQADLRGEFTDDVVAWSRHIDLTDLPNGDWTFYICDDREGATPFRCILPSEY